MTESAVRRRASCFVIGHSSLVESKRSPHDPNARNPPDFHCRGCARVSIGQPAPDFALTDVNGKAVKPVRFRANTWCWRDQPGCPFVVRSITKLGTCSPLQKDATAKGVVWLSVNSTNKSATDYLEPTKLNAKMNGEWKGASSYLLMDETGKAGMAYEAKTTPHMYVIDLNGKLVYAGGSTTSAAPTRRTSRRRRTLSALPLTKPRPGKPITVATSTPYGCSIKCIRKRPLLSEKPGFSRAFSFS